MLSVDKEDLLQVFNALKEADHALRISNAGTTARMHVLQSIDMIQKKYGRQIFKK